MNIELVDTFRQKLLDGGVVVGLTLDENGIPETNICIAVGTSHHLTYEMKISGEEDER